MTLRVRESLTYYLRSPKRLPKPYPSRLWRQKTSGLAAGTSGMVHSGVKHSAVARARATRIRNVRSRDLLVSATDVRAVLGLRGEFAELGTGPPPQAELFSTA